MKTRKIKPTKLRFREKSAAMAAGDFSKIPEKNGREGSRIVVITGGSGSGKTLLANFIAEKIYGGDCEVISHDMYYLDKDNFDPEYRVDYDAPQSLDNSLLAAHLVALKNGEGVDTPIYDFQSKDRLEKTLRVEPKKIVIVEGILTLAVPEIRRLADLSIFIHVDDDIRLSRRIIRDFVRGNRGSVGGGGLEGEFKYYFEYVKPNYKKFIAPLTNVADIVLRNNGKTPELMLKRAENILTKFRI
ncbi:AAA family ATPase [Patescibacteria group bacterium]|nr:AAA family ATPase [Patescibacteria group bacterium]